MQLAGSSRGGLAPTGNDQPYLAYIALAAVCLIWGTTYLALRIAVLNFPPFLFTAIRQSTAGLLLLLFMFTLGGEAIPPRSFLWRQAVAGFFMITLGNGLVAWGEMHIPSGVAAIICSLEPVLVIVISVLIHRDERPNFRMVAGLVVGLAGVIIMFGEHLSDFSNVAYIAGIVATFTAVAAWASGSIWIKKRHTGSNLFVNAGLQMFFGGLLSLPLSVAFDDLGSVSWSPEVTWSMLYLILVGSLIAYASYAYALRNLPIGIASLYAYINPIVAVVLGWAVLHETLNTRIWIAMALTVTGVYIVNRGYQMRAMAKPQAAPGRP